MIRAQSLYCSLSLSPSGRACLIIRRLAYPIYGGREKMEMFGTYVDCEPRPEQIQPGMTVSDIAVGQSLPESAQYFIQSGVIIR